MFSDKRNYFSLRKYLFQNKSKVSPRLKYFMLDSKNYQKMVETHLKDAGAMHLVPCGIG